MSSAAVTAASATMAATETSTDRAATLAALERASAKALISATSHPAPSLLMELLRLEIIESLLVEVRSIDRVPEMLRLRRHVLRPALHAIETFT
jgi:hypothetical protein